MDAKPSKKGRPRTVPQTGPLFLKSTPRRMQPLPISVATATELDAYVSWASTGTFLSEDEALFQLIEYALTGYFRADKLWQEEKDRTTTNHKPGGSERHVPASPAVVPTPPAAVAGAKLG